MADRGGEIPGIVPATSEVKVEQLGQFAYRLHGSLTSPAGPIPPVREGRPRWADTDVFDFDFYLDFETAAYVIDDDEAEVVRRFPKVGHLYAALPVSDDERRWIDDLREHNWYSEPGDKEALLEARADHPRLIRPIDHQIITVGDRQGVDARDLVRRWAAWRRGADEYSDRSTYEQAIEALLALGQELCPNGEDPDYWVNPPWWGYPEQSG